MRLFHITNKVYEIGAPVSINDYEGEVCYYHLSHPDYQWINDVLDKYKPVEFPYRKKCIYAFDMIENCYSFAYGKEGMHCYEVEMDACGGFPMALTDRLRKDKYDQDVCKAISEEYWNPKNEWKYLEYLGNEMIIISEHPITNNVMKSKMMYCDDLEKAKKIFHL